MFCVQCGAENLAEAQFCAACGKTLQATPSSSRGKSPPDAADTELGLVGGQVLADRFEIRKLIGVGGMGRVYLAMDQVLERPVAVQVRSAAAGGAKYAGAKTARRTSVSAIIVVGILIPAPFTFFPKIQIEPANFTINVGESKKLVAHVSGSWYTAVTWSSDVGRISEDGLYPAAILGYHFDMTFKVRATSKINPYRYVEAAGFIPEAKLLSIPLAQRLQDLLKK